MQAFSAEQLQEIQTIIQRYPEGKQKSALLPVLHIAQRHNNGWLNIEIMDCVAQLLQITPIEVYEVATFYTMFNLKPVGKYLLEVCRTGPCCLVGAENIIQHIENKLGIKEGETTPDKLFTLKTVECLASCGTAPMLQIGEKYHEHLTIEKIDQLIDQCRKESGQFN